MIDKERLNLIKDLPIQETLDQHDYEQQQLRYFETKLIDVMDRCENKEIKQVWYKKFNWLQLNISKYINYLRLKNYVSSKKK